MLAVTCIYIYHSRASKPQTIYVSDEKVDIKLGMNNLHPKNVVIGSTISSTTVAAATTTHTPEKGLLPRAHIENGIWLWEPLSDSSLSQQEKMLDRIKEVGFTSVYQTVDDYLETSSKSAYSKKLSLFIAAAHARGIVVDVEGGWRDWAEPENRSKGFALIDFVTEYNIKYPDAKIRALQYDVEPYLLSEYEDNKEEILTDFVAFIDESSTRMQKTDAKFSVVIPHFYDSAQQWTPRVEYDGRTEHTFTHLLRSLERKKGNTIILMSYRNFFEGKDGVEGLSSPEIREARGFSTKIIVAQETGDVSPEYVTYYGKSMAEYTAGLETIVTQFSGSKGFGGVATHYYDSYFNLE